MCKTGNVILFAISIPPIRLAYITGISIPVQVIDPVPYIIDPASPGLPDFFCAVLLNFHGKYKPAGWAKTDQNQLLY